MLPLHRYLLFFLSIIVLLPLRADPTDQEHVIVIHAEQESNEHTAPIASLFSTPTFIETITYTSDVPLSAEEFYYLLGFQAGSTITHGDVEKSLFCFGQKNKFKTITMRIKQGLQGKQLHYVFDSYWLFKRLKVDGIWFNKDKYRQYYMLEAGDVFDENKHKESLEKMSELFRAEGYYNNTITPHIHRDEKTKMVNVKLSLYKGQRFAVNAVTVAVKADCALSSDEITLVRHQLHKKYANQLRKNYYVKDQLDQQVASIKQFLAEKGFLDTTVQLQESVNVTAAVLDVHLVVTLHNKRPFIFFGNYFFSRTALLDHLLQFGRSAWLLPTSILVDELLALYHAKGFLDVAIQTEEEGERLFFIITEGQRAYIRDIIVSANNAMDQALLIKTCFAAVHRKHFDADFLDSALRKLSDFYYQEGFINFRVIQHAMELLPHTRSLPHIRPEGLSCGDPEKSESKEADLKSIGFSGDKNNYVLRITVDEGERHYLANLNIDGEPDLLTQGPFKKNHLLLENKKKVPFCYAMIEEQKEWLTGYMQRIGCFNRTIKVDVSIIPHIRPEGLSFRDPKQKSKQMNGVDGGDSVTGEVKEALCKNNDVSGDQNKSREVAVTWHINRDKKDVFGKTIVVGSAQVALKPLLSCLRYRAGDAWNHEKISQSFMQLKALDIFDSIHLSNVSSPSDVTEHIVLLKAQQDNPWELRTRLGFELQQIQHYKNLAGITYKVGGTFIAKNPAHICDQFRCDIDLSKLHREIVMRYRWPWWQLPIPVLVNIQAYSIKHEQPGFIGANKNIYTFTQNGLLVGLERKGEYINGEVNIGLEYMETKISEDDVGTKKFARELARAIEFEPKLLGKQIPYIFFEPTLFIDCLDNKLNPTKGTLTVISLKGMFPIHRLHLDGYFVKLLLEQSAFFSVWKIIFALRFRLGHIFHQEFSAIMPAERFYLGGSRSVRSYESDLAPPLGIFVDDQGKTHTVPRGGKSMMNLNLETRFPLFKNLGGVIFQDMGILSPSGFADIRTGHFVLGTGFGLRYATPIGPLRFDIGWKWRTTKPYERSYAWFLTFGQAF